jgi:CBS domain-containing protein
MKTVKQILAKKGHRLHTVEPTTAVFDALRTMAREEIGALVVLEGGDLAGILSERDYARKVILKGRNSEGTPVSAIMTSNVVCVKSDTRVDACMSIMTEKRVRHLVVRDEEELSGVISIGDVVHAIIEDHKFTIEQLEHYITNGR